MSSRDFYEELWRSLPESSAPSAFATRLRFLCSAVKMGQRVLDVGCGEGAFAAELTRVGVAVVGIDVAEEPLRRARVRHPGLDLQLVPIAGLWPFADAAFDAVWVGEVLGHVADVPPFLSEIRRVLRSGGSLLLTTPDTGPLSLLASALSRRAFAERFNPLSDHLRYYNRATLSQLVAGFGFQELALRSVGGLPGARQTILLRAIRSRF